jgi:S1-C subfamily serine protease
VNASFARSAAGGLLLLAAAATLADAPKLDRAELKRLKAATVLLKVKLSDGREVSGSGFFAHDKGLVLTNAHVLGMLEPTSRKPQAVAVVLNSGEADSRTLKGTVLGVDRGSDLGLLRVEGKDLPAPLKLGSAAELAETDDLLVFGFPFGEKLGKAITVSKTSVSSLRKSGTLLTQVQVNGGMHPGNSGGPVTNTKGAVIGVAVSGIKNTQIQFAIPADLVGIFVNGRLAGFSHLLPYRSGDKVLLPVTAELYDPLGKVKKVEVELWAGNPGAPRPASAKEPKAQSGDGPIKRATLKYDGKGTATGEVEVPAKADAKQVYYLRPVYTNGAGQTRWMGTPGNPNLGGAPVERKAVELSYRPKAGGLSQAAMVSQASFRLRDDDERDHSLALNFNLGLIEQNSADAREGVSSKVTLRPSSFRFSVLVDKKPIKGDEDLAQAAKDARYLGGELSLDDQGGVTDGKLDLRKVPRDSREVLAEVGDQMLQSLEVLSVPLPGQLKPLQSWKARRHLLLGSLGYAVPAVADMEYTYLGVQKRAGRDVAVINLGGTVKGTRGAEQSVGGRVTGTAVVDVQTGLTVSSSANVSADMDLKTRNGLWKANGTLAVQVNRAPAVLKKKEEKEKSGK